MSSDHRSDASVTIVPISRPAQGVLSAVEEQAPRFVHPSAKRFFRKCHGKCSVIRSVPIFGQAIECYGPLLIFVLSLTYFLFKGISYHILSLSLNAMFQNHFQTSTQAYQRFRTVATMGFSIKPITALLSDAFAVWGYKKRWFLTFSAVMAAAAAIGFALLPAGPSSAKAGAGLAFLSGYGYANLDILLEGLYARRIRQQPSGGPSMVSATYVPQMIGSIVAAFVQGPTSDMGLPWVGNVVAGGCAALCILPLALNWAGEDTNRIERLEDVGLRSPHGVPQAQQQQRQDAMVALSPQELSGLPVGKELREPIHSSGSRFSEEEEEYEVAIPSCCGGVIEFNKQVLSRNYRVTFFCVIMTLVVVATAVVTTLCGGYPLLGCCVGGASILIFMMFWALPRVVAKAALYAFICQALYVNIAAPLEGFYLSGERCNPGGPHFTYFFYNTISGVVGNVTGLAGVLGFAYIFSKKTYRVTFIITVAAEIIGSIFDLVMVRRWNLVIGIPDHYFYIFGDAVVYQVAYWLAWMPMVLLLAQLCPKGSEAMVYSLLVSIFNFGTTIAGEIGSLLLEWVWPVSSKGTCDFTHLWKLIILSHMALPTLIIISTFFLIPSCKVSDALDHSGKTVSQQDSSPLEEVEE